MICPKCKYPMRGDVTHYWICPACGYARKTTTCIYCKPADMPCEISVECKRKHKQEIIESRRKGDAV